MYVASDIIRPRSEPEKENANMMQVVVTGVINMDSISFEYTYLLKDENVEVNESEIHGDIIIPGIMKPANGIPSIYPIRSFNTLANITIYTAVVIIDESNTLFHIDMKL